MQRLTLVRYTVKPGCAEENETLSRAVFAELRATAPDHVTYALFRDGMEFVHLFINARSEDSSAVTGLASFEVYAKGVTERCVAPPEPLRLSLELLESHGLAPSA